jgi:hypothetical protein
MPICFFNISNLDAKTLKSYKKCKMRQTTAASEGSLVSTEMLRAFAVYGGLTRFIPPLCSAAHERVNPELLLTSCLYLVDISGFGLLQACSLREYTEDISQLLADNYAEVIDRAFVSRPSTLRNLGAGLTSCR